MIQLVWFKRDLRTVDHAPLAEAARSGPVLPLYVLEPEYWRLPEVSRRQWLAQRDALEELSRRLAFLGAPLVVRSGDVVEILERIHGSLGIARLLAHEETGNLWTYRRDRAVRAYCRRSRIPFQEFTQTGVIRGAGAGARDHWAVHFARFAGASCAAEPARLTPAVSVKTTRIPTIETAALAADGCDAPQSGTREEALSLLASFLDGRGADYRRGMSSPLGAAACCSRLSVPLATGAVSVREVIQTVVAARRRLSEASPAQRPVPLTALDSLTARLHWRGHFTQKLESEPELERRAFHPLHEAARPSTTADDPRLLAWAEGRTGIPFVDACMRSLIATGWLNFRMRAMLQSFAAYHLGLDWRASGERLARLFTDYEPGIHWPQVQMQSGQTGINTPRIYNPVKQGHDQDPEGVFTRRWLPELAAVPPPLLQTPWLAPMPGLGDYPPPIVDLAESARAAKARLTALRRGEGYRAAAEAVFARHGSRKRRIDDDAMRGRPRSKRPPSPPAAQLSLDLETDG